MKPRLGYTVRTMAMALFAVGLAACDFDVTNPGPTLDADLNDERSFQGLVNGMSGDLSQAVDNAGYASALLAEELISTGFTPTWIAISEGRLVPSDADGFWNNAQRARWVAEDGIRRMEEAGFTGPPLARAYLLAGFASRFLGENFCEAVFDGGPREESFTAYFDRAADHFNTARDLADDEGEEELSEAATAGLASVTAALGNWEEAAALAAPIPIDHEYEAIFSLNSSRETSDQLINFPLEQSEGTVWGTRWEEVTDDPRVPWEVALDLGGEPRTGRDGETPWLRALKYPTRGSNVRLSSGTEMSLIVAEAALRDDDMDGFLDGINDAREFHEADEVLSVGSEDEAWDLLMYDRAADLWLEARNLWDRRRFLAEGRDDFLQGRESHCIPIGEEELNTNSNL